MIHKITLPASFNKSLVLMLLLCIGALFIKNPKLYGVSISDVALLGSLGLLLTYRFGAINKINSILLSLGICFFLIQATGIFRLPDKLVFLLYYTRLVKSFLMCVVGYLLFDKLKSEEKWLVLQFFFYSAIVTIILDTIYSLHHYYSLQNEISNTWLLYAALKVSYIYSDKNMVAFTISMLMILSNRFFKNKYLFFLWFLTLVSLSRSGILVNTFLLLYLVGRRFLKPSVILLTISTLALTCLLVYLMDLQNLFLDRLTLSKDLSLEGRMKLQLTGINMWLDAPIFGKGLSGYQQYFNKYFLGGEQNAYPHNVYVYVLAEFGLVGFLLLTVIFALIFLQLLKKRLGLLIIAYAMFGMFLFNFTEYHFFFLVGILLAYNSTEKVAQNSLHTPLAG